MVVVGAVLLGAELIAGGRAALLLDSGRGGRTTAVPEVVSSACAGERCVWGEVVIVGEGRAEEC